VECEAAGQAQLLDHVPPRRSHSVFSGERISWFDALSAQSQKTDELAESNTGLPRQISLTSALTA